MTKEEMLSRLRAYVVACEKFGYISPAILQDYATETRQLFEDNTDTLEPSAELHVIKQIEHALDDCRDKIDKGVADYIRGCISDYRHSESACQRGEHVRGVADICTRCGAMLVPSENR